MTLGNSLPPSTISRIGFNNLSCSRPKLYQRRSVMISGADHYSLLCDSSWFPNMLPDEGSSPTDARLYSSIRNGFTLFFLITSSTCIMFHVGHRFRVSIETMFINRRHKQTKPSCWMIMIDDDDDHHHHQIASSTDDNEALSFHASSRITARIRVP